MPGRCRPVGFAALKSNDHIDMLYVHPSAVGQGVGVAVLVLLPVAYPTYVGIFLVTGAFRLAAAATADVGETWDAATRIHHGGEVVTEAALESQR